MSGLADFIVFLVAALISLLAAAVVARVNRVQRLDRAAVIVALVLTGLWSGGVAALGIEPPFVRLLEIARNLAWIAALFRHFSNDGRDEALRLVRPLALTLGLVESLQAILLLFVPANMSIEVSAVLRMLVAVGALTLVHNLHAGASDASRRLLAWNSAAMALFWGLQLNLSTATYLTGAPPDGLELMRGAVVTGCALMLAIGAVHAREGLTFRPSRAVTFNTLSLAVLAVYVLAMVGLANGAARMSQDLARVTQVGFLLAAVLGALLWLPSSHLRAHLRVLALKHFFKHRYDYREEWLQFTRTMASGASQEDSLQLRAIQSLADIADSPAGLLLTPREDGDLELAARWCWPTADVPAAAFPVAYVRLLERQRLIVDFDEERGPKGRLSAAVPLPDWLTENRRAWAGVPLLHGDRLVGLVVLARPIAMRRLDWEDFDLLSVAGQQVASYLAEQASQQALEDAARFEEFNRRMAFVMHDIKNLSSQLGLLARNAERHADNPDFRADMLVTLRNSADKLNALVTRLGRYGRAAAEEAQEIDLADLARVMATRRKAAAVIECTGEPSCVVLATREPLEQALDHLIQNAIDASSEGSPIVLEVGLVGLFGSIAVVDAGSGMSPEFIRHSLFRPFVSTKENGFGIGTCEARELVRSMGGRLDVESLEGIGSRFTIALPTPHAARLLVLHDGHATSPQQEKAA